MGSGANRSRKTGPPLQRSFSEGGEALGSPSLSLLGERSVEYDGRVHKARSERIRCPGCEERACQGLLNVPPGRLLGTRRGFREQAGAQLPAKAPALHGTTGTARPGALLRLSKATAGRGESRAQSRSPSSARTMKRQKPPRTPGHRLRGAQIEGRLAAGSPLLRSQSRAASSPPRPPPPARPPTSPAPPVPHGGNEQAPFQSKERPGTYPWGTHFGASCFPEGIRCCCWGNRLSSCLKLHLEGGGDKRRRVR